MALARADDRGAEAMDNETHVAAGTGRRGAVLGRNPWLGFAAVGVVLVGSGVALPALDSVLFSWGAFALVVAALLRFVTGDTAVPASVVSDVYTTMAANSDRDRDPNAPQRYVPDDGGVRLDGREPVGERLLARVDADTDPATAPSERAAQLVDALVNHLEIADHAAATVREDGATVTVRSRIATDERRDHPVVSVVGVGLAGALDRPVVVETGGEGDGLELTCRWDAGESGATEDASK